MFNVGRILFIAPVVGVQLAAADVRSPGSLLPGWCKNSRSKLRLAGAAAKLPHSSVSAHDRL